MKRPTVTPRKATPRLVPISRCRTVAELLASPRRWTQGFSAVDSHDELVSVTSPDACRFCLTGAINHIYSCEEAVRARMRLYDIIGSQCNLVNWNDSPRRTHAQVLAAVRKAGV